VELGACGGDLLDSSIIGVLVWFNSSDNSSKEEKSLDNNSDEVQESSEKDSTSSL
jgi:hypothetical protein